MPNLAGLHDIESVAIAPPDTWVVDTVALSENPVPKVYPTSLNIIARLNNGYGSTGTIPIPEQYDTFARKVARYVQGSNNCHRWIIGNEPNLSREWPDGQPIMPWQYAQCYRLCRREIIALPGHEHDEVLIAAPGPWNAELKYSGNPSGDWIRYFTDVIEALDEGIDGFALHAYAHGYDRALVTSTIRMGAPFQNRYYNFRTYVDYCNAIPDSLRHLPAYITEANGNGPWQAVGLMPEMLREIDSWNSAYQPKIQCVIFYRYPHYDDFYIAGRNDVIAEYQAAVAKGYTSPAMGANSMPDNQLFIPAVSTGTQSPTLPPRQYDPRLKERGVDIDVTATHDLAPGQKYWFAKEIRWLNEQESQGRHHILGDTYKDGAKVAGVPLKVIWPSGGTDIKSEDKSKDPPPFSFWYNFPMSPSLTEYSIQVDDGTPTEVVNGIGMGADGNSHVHTSTVVEWELATMPQAQTPTPPQPDPAPAPAQPAPVPLAPIEPRVAQAILAIESAGASFGPDGRPLIRFEAHIFKSQLHNDALWSQHFQVDTTTPWTNQMWRGDPNSAWQPLHTNQASEYAAFDLARSLNPDAAYNAISVGSAQIVGFNHARIGYRTAEAMYNAFADGNMQVIGFINYLLSDPDLAAAMRNKDWRTIAAKYNGTGAIESYSKKLQQAYESLGGAV